MLSLALPALASAKELPPPQELRIAHIYSKTGPLEAYGKQTATGFTMGLEYATGGSMSVAGRKLVVTEHDDEGKPERGRQLLEAAYGEGRADLAVGPTSSGVALAMLPVAQAHKKVLIVEPAVADAITGEKWNRYVFRTGRNSSQDAISNAVALDQAGVHVATLAQDTAFGRDGIRAFKDALKQGKVVHEEYMPQGSADFAAARQRLVESLKGKPGRKVIWVLWAGAGSPFTIADAELKAAGIEMATGGNTLPAMVQFNRLPGMQGAAYYYFGFPRGNANMWLVSQHFMRYNEPPDMFTAGGFSAAMAIVTALKKSAGVAQGDMLVDIMEGMSFDTPKGTMTFRRDDHQAIQSMYHFRVSAGAMAGRIPDLRLVREIAPDEIAVPVRNKR
ncbi:substrate-binding domain-containing protein [Piscinibacter gummiphilus]|uniref:Substrate-binding domain-containing protein n=2 Tax=Piscinibacter gummiphilus TaxID=946333 RepID=A0ABZ0D655_9BURK|nr:substrate-binding domain-containing protein [Piscinibacter gummiphilus]WOB11006.1 substrate-binding domain-containing protein [Piscinibacter gummiphilus]